MAYWELSRPRGLLGSWKATVAYWDPGMPRAWPTEILVGHAWPTVTRRARARQNRRFHIGSLGDVGRLSKRLTVCRDQAGGGCAAR